MRQLKLLSVVMGMMTAWVCAADAGQFMGIDPGTSTRNDVIRVLGEPVEKSFTNNDEEQLLFNAENQDLEKLIITFYKNSDLVRQIDGYPYKEYTVEQYRTWFTIEEPFESESDAQGRLIEYYLPQYVALHYQTQYATSPVVFFSHIDPALFDHDLPGGTERPYFGVQLAAHDGEGFKVDNIEVGSPAEKGGLKRFDLIRHIGKQPCAEKNLNPSNFISVLSAQPLNVPLDIKVMRDGTEVTCAVTLVPMTKEMMLRNADESLAMFQKGQFLLDNNDVYGALDCFKAALWYNPDEPLYYTALGDTYDRLGLKELAIEELQKAIQMTPQPMAYYLLGNIHLQSKDFKQAIPYLLKAVALNPTDIEIREKLALCYFEEGQFTLAQAQYQKVFRYEPDAPVALFYMASCYDKLHENTSALEWYERFLEKDKGTDAMKKAARERFDFLVGAAAPAVNHIEDEKKKLK